MDLRRLTRAAAEALPDGVSSGVRALAQSFGTLTARWRMTPDFLVVGAQRAGTTTMYRLLCDHPSVVRPTLSKGIGYFDVHHARGPRWYRGHFPLRLVAGLRVSGAPVTFESSGYYSFHPLAAERIAHELPEVKVVMLVRDPVERAYSAHRHESARGFEDLPFEDAIAAEPRRLEGEVERLVADPTTTSFEHRHHAYLARGQYVEQVERLVQAVGRERVYLVDADRFFASPIEEFTDLADWLGLPAWRPSSVGHWNARGRDEMDPGTRHRLEDHFAPYDRRLADYLDRPPSWQDRDRPPT